MNMMEFIKYEVHSTKHNIRGVITDFHFSLELSFQYNNKSVSIAIERPFPFSESALKEQAQQIMETYIEKLLSGEIKERKLMLHHWYIQEKKDGNTPYLVGRGIVTGHDRLADSTPICTSELKRIELDEVAEEIILHTKNSIYHCPLLYCCFRRQDRAPGLLADYEKIKEKYQGKLIYPSIEPGKVLLVLSNFDEYYFHCLHYQPEGENSPLEYAGVAHVGSFQDSFLIQTDDYRIDLRYFPHYQNIEFYSTDTDGKPLFIENIGDITLYAKTHCGVFRLEPGERKEIKRANAEKEKPILPGGDLYPAEFLG